MSQLSRIRIRGPIGVQVHKYSTHTIGILRTTCVNYALHPRGTHVLTDEPQAKKEENQYMRRPFFALLFFVIMSPYASAQSPNALGLRALAAGGTLQDAARAARGRFVETFENTGLFAYQNVRALAKESRTIVIGSAVTNVCKLADDGRDIYTSYTFRIEERIKGANLRPGDTVTVDLPGGRVSFPDGSTAQINTPQFPRIINGNRYVLFLMEQGKGPDLTPVGGPQGVFELRDDGFVLAFARSYHSLPSQSGRTVDEFVHETRQTVGKND
jgi:hypothetical protein